VPPQGQCQNNCLQNGEGFLRYCLQHLALVQLPFGPSSGDAGPGDSHICFSVDGREPRFVTDPALCD
jgi:hypothetical protein